MSAPIVTVDTWNTRPYDMIIDVRAPCEFANDHIPSAVNLPVLSDEQRGVVGTLYKQSSPFEARKVGAAFVSQNIAKHLETVLADQSSDFEPLIHCWRGGQRSNAFAQICSAVGWRSYVLEGGYKTYRREVVAQLDKLPRSISFVAIAGRTGVRKTDLLVELSKRGAQTIDLEAIASHRGSLLGGMTQEPQPSQRMFETRLAQSLRSFDCNKPVFVESESSRIGALQIPAGLWKLMSNAPRILVSAPRDARADYLLNSYDHLTTDTTALENLMQAMTQRVGRERTAFWRTLVEQRAWKDLASELLENHYDPAYDRSLKKRTVWTIKTFEQQDCSDASLRSTVDGILSAVVDIKSPAGDRHLVF